PLGSAWKTRLAGFVRWSCERFLCVSWSDTDFFQKRLHRLFAAEELLDRNANVTRIAWLVDLMAQFHARLFVEVSILCCFENCRHICSDGVRPGVPIVTSIVPVEAEKARDEARLRIDWQKNALEDLI